MLSVTALHAHPLIAEPCGALCERLLQHMLGKSLQRKKLVVFLKHGHEGSFVSAE